MFVSMGVNGRAVEADVEPRTTLADLIRDHLGLTGTHVGCDTGQCGACTVHLDGRAVKACSVLAGQAEGAEVTTIEGLSDGNGGMHPMQEAFKQCHGLQCGFCTPGMVMTSIDVVNSYPDPSEGQVREALQGNYCRCTGYHNIVRAVFSAAEATRRMA